MQRVVLRQWWVRSEQRKAGVSFTDFLAADAATRTHLHWPNWCLEQNFRTAVRRTPDAGKSRCGLVFTALFHSLWINLKTGFQGICNTWLLTLPAGLLWVFAWYDGWNNSFNKGYEQYYVGMIIGGIGVLLFIAAMFYVPLAQARQAVTGDWRAFYQFKLIWSLVRRRWLACLCLAGLYSLLSLPAMMLKAAPAFFAGGQSPLADATPAKVVAVLNGYFFWASLWILPAFVVLRIVAARIYGSAIVSAVQSGALAEDQLAKSEWAALNRLDLLRVRPEPTRHILVRLIAWAGTRAGRIAAGFATWGLWFSLVAQIYVSEFFKYNPGLGFLNQPLIQLPWFRYLPPYIENPAKELGLAVLILAVVLGVRWGWNYFRQLRAKL